jgi:hypothetical protein
MSKAEVKDLPPDVYLGKDFFKGKTISERRNVLAERRRTIFPDERADILIIRKDVQGFFELPVLEAINNVPVGSWVPRVEPLTGTIWTTRWAKKVSLIKTEHNKHQVEAADDFVVIGGKRFSENTDLKALPLSWKVSQLIPQNFNEGIEAAMRQEDEIAHDYSTGGVENLRVLASLASIYQASEELKKPGLNAQDLIDIGKGIEETLRRENILGARNSVWQTMVEKIQRAAKKDSLDRLNPSASRFLAISAYLRAIDREGLGNLVRAKAERTFSYLFMVRLATRLRIREVIDGLDTFGNFDRKFGYQEFKERYQSFSVKDSVDIEQMLKLFANDLREIQPAPYFIYARLADAILMGKVFKSNKETAHLYEILKQQGVESELEKPSADDFLRRKDSKNFYFRLKLAYTILSELLNDPDYRVYTVFSEQIPEY